MVFNHFMCPTDENTASSLLEAIRPLQLVSNSSRTQFSIIHTQPQIAPQPGSQCPPQVKCEPSSRIVFLPSSHTLQQQNETASQEDTTEAGRISDSELHMQIGEMASELCVGKEAGYQGVGKNDCVQPLMKEDENETPSSTVSPTQELQVITDCQSSSLNELQTSLEKEMLTPPKKRRCPEWNDLGSPGAHSTSSVEGVLRVRSDLSVSASPHPYLSDAEENSEDM